MVHKRKSMKSWLVNYVGGQHGIWAGTAKLAKEKFKRQFPNRRIVGKIRGMGVI